MAQSTFDRLMAAQQEQEQSTPQIAQIYAAYKSGQMDPQAASEFEADVKSGAILLPKGASLATSKTVAPTAAATLPAGVIDAYKSGAMSRQDKIQLESDVKRGIVQWPKDVPLQNTEPLGVLGGIKEAITGAERSTKESESLPEWTSMPELNSFSMASAKTALGTLLSNPGETVQIIKANYPQVTERQDEKGNFIMRSQIDGKEYVIPPGFRTGDIPRAAGGIAAFTPAGRASTLLGTAAAAGATQAAIEGTQAATGGEFNPGEVATAALTAPIIPAAVQGVKAIAAPARNAIARALGREVPQAPGIGAVPEAPVSTPQAAPVVPAATQAAEAAPMGVTELGQTTRKAALGGIGSKRAVSELAEQAAPDAETVAAAERLGIADYLQPDHVTTNQAFRQISQLVKSQTGSEAAVAQRQGLEKVAERANALVDELGGSADLSTTSANVRASMTATQNELENAANTLYNEVRSKIPAKASAPADSALEFVKQRADELGGAENLSQMEKRILRKLSPNEAGEAPTYALLDDVRKEVGSATRGQGVFKDADTGLAKKLYTLLSDDQALAAEAHGAGDVYNAARSAVSVRKGMEDDMVALFGKQLERTMTPMIAGAVKDLGKGDVAKFAKMMAAVPEGMRQEVAASGLSSFFQRAARGGEMDFAGYSRWFDGLERNQQAKAALFGNLPKESVQQLTDLARVAKGVAMAKGEFIATGKAINPQVLAAADGIMAKVFETASQHGLRGLFAETLGTASGAPGLASAVLSASMKNKPSVLQAADKLITSPEFLQAARAAGTKNEAEAIRRLTRADKFSRFMKQVNGPRDVSEREQWVRAAIQAGQQQNQQDKGN